MIIVADYSVSLISVLFSGRVSSNNDVCIESCNVII
jgi:hypothetical protein